MSPDSRSAISRRRFLLAASAAAASASVVQLRPLWQGAQVMGGEADGLALLPAPEADEVPALARRFPWLWYGERPAAGVQLADALGTALESDPSDRGVLGERVFRARGAAAVVPWAPMFRRSAQLALAPALLRQKSGARYLVINDEGSDEVLLFGNKIRKYEFVLPNLAAAGVGTVHTHGAYGSNHCAHLALALRYGRFMSEPGTMRLAVGLYPQPLTRDVATKLHLLLASGAGIQFLESDLQTGLSIVERRRMNAEAGTPRNAYIPSGGSSPLAVLGHLNALLELDERIRLGNTALAAAPDYLFVPLGSGATAMGLVLGCHLLGWSTRVFTVPSQDKSLVAKLLVNRDVESPFVVPHARELLDAALGWARRLGLPVDDRGSVTADDLLRRHFHVEREAWRPGYGEMSAEVRELHAVAREQGLTLDATFTAKTFGALCAAGAQGRFRDASVLFWNTYQRFDLASLLPNDQDWLSRLPAHLAEQFGAMRS